MVGRSRSLFFDLIQPRRSKRLPSMKYLPEPLIKIGVRGALTVRNYGACNRYRCVCEEGTQGGGRTGGPEEASSGIDMCAQVRMSSPKSPKGPAGSPPPVVLTETSDAHTIGLATSPAPAAISATLAEGGSREHTLPTPGCLTPFLFSLSPHASPGPIPSSPDSP